MAAARLDVRTAQAATWGPQLRLARNEGAQDIAVLPNGDVLVSQGYLRPGQKKEDTVFSLERNGQLIGEAVAPLAGHGTLFGYRESTGEVIFDWAGKLVAFKWRTGTLSKARHTREIWSKFQAGYVSCSINNYDGTALMRMSRETSKGRRDDWILRSMIHMDAGRDQVLGAVRNLPVTEPQMQGGCHTGTTMFHSTGHGNIAQLLTSYDLTTGKRIATRSLALFGAGHQENQGITWYQPDEGPGQLLVLYTLKRPGRQHFIKSLSPAAPVKPPVTKPASGAGAGSYKRPTAQVVYVDRLRRGVTNSDSVYWFQEAANKLKLGATLGLTGTFGAGEAAAASAYQTRIGDSVDGQLGPLQTTRLFHDAGLAMTVRAAA